MVPVYPPVSPCKGASIVHSPYTVHVFFVLKRRYADVRAGTQAPPLRFRLDGLRVNVEWRLGRLRVGRSVSFVWIARKWLFCLCGIAWKNMMEVGRGGAYVPARVAP